MASLGKDLALIRKEQQLSLEDINGATKIPIRILRSIEDDSIFADFDENSTYIRSYVRSYAKVLAIDEKQIVYALNKTEKGTYSGSLQSYLKEKPEEPFEDGSTNEEEIEEATDSQKEEGNTSTDSLSSEPGAPQDKSEYQSPITHDEPDVRSVDWADMGKKFQPLKTVGSRTWIGIVVFIIISAIGIALYLNLSNSSNISETSTSDTITSPQESSEGVSTDSLELNVVPQSEDDDTKQGNTIVSEEIENQRLTELPDTLSLILYAAYDQLEPVRVYTDIMDDINPYWIEQQEALRFNFVNEIRIRGQYSRMVLILNGHPIENIREEFYNPDTRMLEINRSYFETDPKWLQPAPDSLNIDAPPPAVIRERPTFN